MNVNVHVRLSNIFSIPEVNILKCLQEAHKHTRIEERTDGRTCLHGRRILNLMRNMHSLCRLTEVYFSMLQTYRQNGYTSCFPFTVYRRNLFSLQRSKKKKRNGNKFYFRLRPPFSLTAVALPYPVFAARTYESKNTTNSHFLLQTYEVVSNAYKKKKINK